MIHVLHLTLTPPISFYWLCTFYPNVSDAMHHVMHGYILLGVQALNAR
jgi:hypothetical protein